MRVESLGGLTPIQWLVRELDILGYYSKIDGHCLLLDCTYKTNRFNMPLLNICGVTGNNKTPQFALCFLSSEKEEDYQWALQQFKNCKVSLLEEKTKKPSIMLISL
jgi:hypothetical protein